MNLNIKQKSEDFQVQFIEAFPHIVLICISIFSCCHHPVLLQLDEWLTGPQNSNSKLMMF